MIYFILGYIVGMATLICAMLFLDRFKELTHQQPTPVAPVEETPNFDGSQFLDPEIKAYFDINSGGGYN